MLAREPDLQDVLIPIIVVDILLLVLQAALLRSGSRVDGDERCRGRHRSTSELTANLQKLLLMRAPTGTEQWLRVM